MTKSHKVLGVMFWVAVAFFPLIIALEVVLLFVTGFRRHDIQSVVQSTGIAFASILALLYGLRAIPSTQEEIERNHAISRARSVALPLRGDLPLAFPQPTPDATALSLPITIRMRPRWGAIIFWSFFTPGVFVLLEVAFIALTTDISITSPIVIVIAVTVWLFFSLIAFRSIRTNASLVITATEDGLTFNAPKNTIPTVKWFETSVFALTSGAQSEGQSAAYMLAASPTRIVRWQRMGRPTRFPTREPTLPYEEYERQMDALLSLIAARTGLPLYDLREWRARANTASAGPATERS